jgi:integrase
MELIRLKGTSKRQKRPQILPPEKLQEPAPLLNEPFRTMVIVAMCNGRRVSEVLALCWEHIDFEAGAMLVQQGVVNGRIGKVKTEASNDYIALDSGFAQVLVGWKGARINELLLPSHITGGCHYVGVIQQQILNPAVEKVGLQGIGWHTLRHTYRSLLAETEAPIGVQQELMRHSKLAATKSVYGSACLRAKQQANSKGVRMVIAQEKPQTELQEVAV